MTRALLLSLVLTSVLVETARAETMYIRDILYVPLRGGQSSEHRILHRGLPSGTKVERMEINEDTGYSRIRTDQGLEGWLQTQYLVDEPIASEKLASVTARLEELEARHQQALLRLRQASETNVTMGDTTATLQEKNEALANEIEEITALAANVIAIDEENKQLNEERDGLLAEIQQLNETNESLLDDDAQHWFLRGAGTILLGLLFGLWVGRRIYHRRNTGGWA